MHKRGLCRHAVSVRRVRPSVCLSRSWIMSKRINISSFFSPSGSHTILVFPHQTGWRYSDGNPPNGGVECRWSIGRNRDSGLIAGYWRLLDKRSAKKHLPTTKLSIWHSRPRTTGYRSIAGPANYEVTKTVTDDHAQSATHHRIWRPAAWTNTPKRRKQKRV